MKKQDEELICQYSGLPSPASYECTDYDGMGNHGRFTKPRKNRKSIIKMLKTRLRKRISFLW